MKRRLLIICSILAVSVAIMNHVTLEARRANSSDNEEYYKELELFEHALAIVRSDYTEEPEPQELIYGALKGMLATLDPYSQFMDPDSYNELKVDTEGQFGGLGIEITIRDELLTIITPIDGTPAYKAGLMAGDRVVKIDDELTRGITLMDAVKKLRGKPGTSVKLTVLREGENSLKDFDVVRAIIVIESIRQARIIEEGIAYIRLSDFREKTFEDLQHAVIDLQEQGMLSLILDLRNNPGGLLDASVSVSDLFLDRGKMVVTTKGRLKNQNLEFRARKDSPIGDIPLVVMINEGSASASEIVAGAIQDHKRGIIVGTKSHGKASVQTVFPLRDGSALRLTTSKYFTPSGRSIHGEGIHPDVEIPYVRQEISDEDDDKESAEEVFKKIENGDSNEEDVEDDDFVIDNQLARAIDLLKGIRVYLDKESETF